MDTRPLETKVLQQRTVSASSMWTNNSVLVQMLGLSPLLGVSTSLVNGIGLGIITFAVILASCVTASVLKSHLNHDWRLLHALLFIAIYTTIAELFLQYAYFPLYRSLGIYVPLVCCNAAILIRMETYSRHVSVRNAVLDAVQTGLGFFLVIVVFSAVRELFSNGTLLYNSELLRPFLGNESESGYIATSQANASFKFPTLPAGAFILFSFLLALKTFLNDGPGSKRRSDRNIR